MVHKIFKTQNYRQPEMLLTNPNTVVAFKLTQNIVDIKNYEVWEVGFVGGGGVVKLTYKNPYMF